MNLAWIPGKPCITETYYATAEGESAHYIVNRCRVAGEWVYTLWLDKIWVNKFSASGAARAAAQSLEDRHAA